MDGCLLELAAPSMIQTLVSGAFLQDVRDSIEGQEGYLGDTGGRRAAEKLLSRG